MSLAAITYKDGSADYTPISGQLEPRSSKKKNLSRRNLAPIYTVPHDQFEEEGLNNDNLRKDVNSAINKKEITKHILKDDSKPAETGYWVLTEK